jgi:hypothetical protein
MNNYFNEIPEELVYEILSYNYSYDSNLNEINKKCRQIFNKEEFKYKINKIMKWYKNNTFNFNCIYLDKTYFIKFFKKYYPINNFRTFPEFFIKKMNRNDLKKYIKNNLNKDFNKRKKINLIKFLNHQDISIQDLYDVGW